MIETHITRTYDEAFARARAERAQAFRDLFAWFRIPAVPLVPTARRAAH